MSNDRYSVGEVVTGLLSVFWVAFVLATVTLIAWKVVTWAWS